MSERIEDLQYNGLKIIQDDEFYTFSSDSVILANFVKTKKEDVAVEIGAGCGVVSILVSAKNLLKKIYAFEIQPEMASLARKNVEFNKIEKISVIEDDIKNFKTYLKEGSADVVFSNPPYFNQTKFLSSNSRKIAREEVCLNCEELCQTASKLLKFGGNFFVCYNCDRVAELIFTLQKYGLATKELFFTENGKGEVKLAVLRATKGGKFGCKVRPNLVTNEKDGTYISKI